MIVFLKYFKGSPLEEEPSSSLLTKRESRTQSIGSLQKLIPNFYLYLISQYGNLLSFVSFKDGLFIDQFEKYFNYIILLSAGRAAIKSEPYMIQSATCVEKL